MISKELLNDQVEKYVTGPLFFQILVGSGETVELLAKHEDSPEFTKMTDYTESTWDKAVEFPRSSYKFVVPAGSRVFVTN